MQNHDTLEALDTLLAGRAGSMPAWQVRALFLGALASTNMRLGPHHLISYILGDEEPVFESHDEVRALVSAMGALWNELTENVRGGVRLSDFPLPAEPALEDLRALAKRRHDELLWFVRGIDAGGDNPAEFGRRGRELFSKLAEASAYFQGYNELPERVEKGPSTRELGDSLGLLGELTHAAEGLITELLELGRKVRLQALGAFDDLTRRGRTDDGVRAGARKVGRNDLCPCASGKKWKRCCGV